MRYFIFAWLFSTVNIGFANECKDTLQLNGLIRAINVERNGKQMVEYSAPNQYKGNDLLGIFLFLKYEEHKRMEYDGYLRTSLDSINGYSTAKFWVPVDYKSDDPWPASPIVFVRALYVPPWEDKEKILMEQCISVMGTIYLKHNNLKNQSGSNAGTGTQNAARPF